MSQSASVMQNLPYSKARKGQLEVFSALEGRKKLNIQLPTGYGKTYAGIGSYSILKSQGKVNRLLVIFPTDAQLNQFEKDGASNLMSAGVDEPRSIVDVRFYGVNAVRKHRTNSSQVYGITVQALMYESGMNIIQKLLETGKWMIIVDEYHHYGIEARWGKSVLDLNSEFILAMSATPSRRNGDSAFGAPDISVGYRQAVEEKAVKPLKGHSYTYRIDAVMENGDITSFTTDDLISEVGSALPEKIESYKIDRQMRWSPKYVSPLVTIPIERMLKQRISTGYRLQAIVGAMCVSHAKLVSDQISSLFPELSVDWVGTGDNGRDQEINKSILGKFCPKKDERGDRTPTLDILVHVGMAGEGLDSILVSEVIHLNKASKNNSNDQENGRAARFIDGVTGNINFDSTSEYAVKGYIGDAIMDAMDGNEPGDPDDEKDPMEEGDEDEFELPDEPKIQIWNMELESINSGDIDVQRATEVFYERGMISKSLSELNENPDSPEWEQILNACKIMRSKEAEKHDEPAIIMQWRESVNNAARVVTGRIIRMMSTDGMRVEKSLAGDIKKRLFKMKKMQCGAITEDVDVCKKHYTWIKNLEVELIDKGIPSWLL